MRRHGLLIMGLAAAAGCEPGEARPAASGWLMDGPPPQRLGEFAVLKQTFCPAPFDPPWDGSDEVFTTPCEPEPWPATVEDAAARHALFAVTGTVGIVGPMTNWVMHGALLDGADVAVGQRASFVPDGEVALSWVESSGLAREATVLSPMATRELVWLDGPVAQVDSEGEALPLDPYRVWRGQDWLRRTPDTLSAGTRVLAVLGADHLAAPGDPSFAVRAVLVGLFRVDAAGVHHEGGTQSLAQVRQVLQKAFDAARARSEALRRKLKPSFRERDAD